MHLLRLSIKNFRVIKNVTLEFPDKVIGIIGPNGAGKSSIVEAIAWALYGNVAARSSKDEIRATFAGASATAEVDLEFEIRGEHYRVVRRLIGRTERPEVILYRGGASESVGSTETQKHIAGLLGLDWKGFLTSFLARQQELNALSDLAAGKRRDHLAGMLGIDRLDKALQLIKADTRSAGERSTLLGQRLSEREHILIKVSELSENLGKLQLEKDRQLGAQEKSKTRLLDIQKRFTQAQADKDTCSQLMAGVDVEQNSLTLLDQQIQQLNREHEMVLRDEQMVARLEKTLSGYTDTKSKYEREHGAVQAIKLIDELDGQIRKSKADLARLSKSKAEAEQKKEELSRQLDGIPKDLDRLISDKTTELEKAREDYSRIRSEREIASRDVKKISDQLAGIRELGPDAVCDRCLRPYGNDLASIREHLNTELSEVRSNLDKLSQEVMKIKSNGEAIKLELTEFEQRFKIRQDLNGQIGILNKEIKRLNDEEDLAKAGLLEYSARLSKLDRPAFNPAKLKELKQALETMESDRRELDKLIGRVSRKGELVKQLSDIQEKSKQTNIKLDDLKARISELGFDPANFETLSGEHRGALRNAEDQNTAVAQATKELELVQNELKLRTEQLDQFTQVEADLEEVRTSHYYGEKLTTLVGDFRKYLIASIRPRLAEISTTLFSEMTADKYGMVELDKDYNLRIMDYGQMFGIDRYSGGEKDLANLCLRLAISIALTESAGLDRSFVILDEVFGSQDTGRRDLIFKGLANLKQRFPQVFLITHVGEIKNRVETLIEINPTSAGWSEVIIDGNLAS